MLSVDGLGFKYGRRDVLRDISFEAEGGKVISILGPNGVGKTTLLKCLCNVHRPQSGTVSLDGEDILTLPPRDLARHIAYVPQKMQPLHSKVFDYVLIGRRPYVDLFASSNDTDIAWNVIHSMDLDHLATKYMDSISGGEFQKVQLARALTQDPDVLILDEPTSSLDMSNAYRSMRMIHDSVRNENICTIMTMHDFNLAACFSDRFIFMKDGRICRSGGKEIISSGLIKEVYGIDMEVVESGGKPYVIPVAETRVASDGAV